MPRIIPHNKPTLKNEEVASIKRVINSGWVAQGKEVLKFENEFGHYLGGRNGQAVAVSSGTAALFLSLYSLNIKNGDEIIIPTYTCTAVLNATFMVGAKPVLVDINRENLNISYPETLKRINKKTKAIIMTHTFGYPADAYRFNELGIPLIEDCAQALGARLNGHLVGTFGEIAIFSFYASKVITTGYGGMIFSKNKTLINKIRDYREFDCRDSYKPRFNFQMSDIQAALGRVQLRRLPLMLKRREEIAKRYYESFPEDKVWPRRDREDITPNYYRFLLISKNPRNLKKFLLKNGINTILPIENHELLHRYLKEDAKKFPLSEKVSKVFLSLPIFPLMTKSDVSRITEVVRYSEFI